MQRRCSGRGDDAAIAALDQSCSDCCAFGVALPLGTTRTSRGLQLCVGRNLDQPFDTLIGLKSNPT